MKYSQQLSAAYALPLFEEFLTQSTPELTPGYIRTLRPGDDGYLIGQTLFSIFRSIDGVPDPVRDKDMALVAAYARETGWAVHYCN